MSALHDDPRRLDLRVGQLRAGLQEKAEPIALAARSGTEFFAEAGTSEIRLSLFGRPLRVSFPEFVVFEPDGKESNLATQVLLLYYLTIADGTPVEGRWVSYADLPDGRFYSQAFQGYTGRELAKHFGGNLEAFCQAAKKLDGMNIAYGDAAFAFHILPRVMLAAVYHLGDEDFPSTCQILFDASTSHYLPTDVCAILGSMLTRKLLNL